MSGAIPRVRRALRRPALTGVAGVLALALQAAALPAAAKPPAAKARAAAPQLYGPPAPPTPYDLCEAAIARAQTRPIPATLLPAIARVESGRLDPATGRVRPWPWTINVEGQGSFYDNKEAVIEKVRALQADGKRSIDVGCMQVNLLHHPHAFASLDEAFEPASNAAYAVKFLTALYGQTKDWALATAWYHSATQDRGEDYQKLVFGRVVTPMGPPRPGGGRLAAWNPNSIQFGAFAPSTVLFGAFTPGAAPAFNRFSLPQTELVGRSLAGKARRPGIQDRPALPKLIRFERSALALR